MGLYRKRGIWYAPKWRSGTTGVEIPAHSLGTADKKTAESRWVTECARAINPAALNSGNPLQLELPAGPRHKLSDTFADYLERKKGEIAPATLEKYYEEAGGVLASLGDYDVEALAGPTGTVVLQEWSMGEVARLKTRTHTVVKRLESIVKPSLKLAHHMGRISTLPLWPAISSDYHEAGARKIWFRREEYARFRAELAEEDVLVFRDGRPSVRCYPRLAADIHVGTGMHAADVDTFAGRDWDATPGQWWRRNAKGARYYRDDWFRCDAWLQQALRAAWAGRYVDGWRLWVADATTDDRRTPALPEGWMRHRIAWAAKRAGLPYVPSPIDFRRTFATWRREEGWGFDEVALVLANSTGMVRQVYAQIPTERMDRAAEKSEPTRVELTRLTGEIGARKGPKNAAWKKAQHAVANRVKITSGDGS